METPFLNTAEAAQFLGLSKSWLEVLRVKGGGPVFKKLGRRVIYRRDDLEAWAAAGTRYSTAKS
ncbi:MAG TPA: helix-turn-helix domain-containing protein [Isosphaeraceae bacterium]|nr:helix-turn-helix domain-containing protein [Isosphaeraceae bacterium]